ncbi:hypothetical protein HPB47_009276 [Ixodes persulcatus]|uniref:Uncharacterized protein n=1 Tax=Ixodes persulcatus TaxID=34615 RepID=A0AC60P2G6_IXOPE|nr:hypothetical protein HPB47_009276 [Ixodes persulcatus]
MLRLSVYADKHHQSFAPINIIHHVEMRRASRVTRGRGLRSEREVFIKDGGAGLHLHENESLGATTGILVGGPGALCYTAGQSRTKGPRYIAVFCDCLRSSACGLLAVIAPSPAGQLPTQEAGLFISPPAI